jgi:glutamate racemase
MRLSRLPVSEHSARSIGVLDSGVGGLSVLREIHHLLPGCQTLYYADTGHLPYGPKPLDEIRVYVENIARFLIHQGAGVIVLACHAASAASLHELRQSLSAVPFVGIEPAVKPAAEATRSGVIGVLTTEATAHGALYRGVVERFAQDVRVLTQPAPELVQLVEEGRLDTPETVKALQRYVQPMIEAGADQVVLACTHFPFLAPALSELVGERAALVDPGPAVARQTARVIGEAACAHGAPHRYYTSGDPAQLKRMLRDLIGVDAEPEAVPV